jgi:UDP-N-acetyl-D-glucosamine dehydrogenase
MNLCVIGQGYVGLTVAVSAAENGHIVLGLDLNKSLVNDLLLGRSYVPGIGKDRLLPLIKTGAYSPTTDENSLQNSEVIIIAVPTPLDLMRNPDLSYLEAATKLIAKNAAKDDKRRTAAVLKAREKARVAALSADEKKLQAAYGNKKKVL